MEASRQSERVNGMLQREMSDIQLHVDEFPPAQNEATPGDKQVFETEMLQDKESFTLFEEQNIGHFLGLPSEIWQCILGHLSFQQPLKFGQTCRRVHELSDNPLLWRQIYQTENKTPMLFDFGNNWKSAFAMVTLCTKINNSLTLQRELDKMQDEMNDTESENAKLQSTLSQLRSTLDFLTVTPTLPSLLLMK